MSGRARHFLSTSAVLFVGTAVAKLVTFFLLPVLTRAVDPAEYGYYDFWTNLIAFVAAICFFQVWDAVYRLWFEKTHDVRDLLLNGSALFLVGILIYIPVGGFLLYMWATSHRLLILILGLLVAVQYYLAAIVRARLRNRLFVTSGVVNAFVAGGATVWLVVYLDMGPAGLFGGTILGMSAQVMVLSVAMVPRRVLGRFRGRSMDIDLQRRMVRYAVPLCIASGAYWLLSGFTRLVVMQVLGADANGLYAVADRLAVAISTLVGVATYAWNEVLFSSHQDEDALQVKERGAKIAMQASLGMGTMALLLMTYGFGVLVSNQFAAAYVLVPLTVSVAVINAIASALGSILMADHRTTALLRSTVVGALVSAPCVVLLTNEFGIVGALVALNIGFATLLVWRWRDVRNHLDISGLGRREFASVILFAASAVFYWSAPSLWSQ